MEIRRLEPELAEVFTSYLSEISFDHEPHWASCYCRFYHTVCPQEEWMNRSAERNKAEALDEIRNGNMKGLLAFDEGKCVGWLNANDAGAYSRLYPMIKEMVEGKKVGCTICFVIHPEYRKQGIATALLKSAVGFFKDDGYDAVLGVPFEMPDEPEKMYRGFPKMFLEQGFKNIANHGPVKVMWLDLH